MIDRKQAGIGLFITLFTFGIVLLPGGIRASMPEPDTYDPADTHPNPPNMERFLPDQQRDFYDTALRSVLQTFMDSYDSVLKKHRESIPNLKTSVQTRKIPTPTGPLFRIELPDLQEVCYRYRDSLSCFNRAGESTS